MLFASSFSAQNVSTSEQQVFWPVTDILTHILHILTASLVGFWGCNKHDSKQPVLGLFFNSLKCQNSAC